MIPEKSNPKWKSIVNGSIDKPIKSFSLQMKVNSLKKMQAAGLVTMVQAIDELYDLCSRYEKIYTEDLNNLFNS